MRGIRFIAVFVAIVLMPGPAFAAPASPPKFIPPVLGEVTERFDVKSNQYGPGSHRGMDFSVPEGTPVRASGDGHVKFAGPVADDGLFVTIEHGGGIETTYSYLSETLVSEGDEVQQGQVIAKSGEGHEGGPDALHFGAKKNGQYIDPALLLYADISQLIQMNQAQGTGEPVLTAGGATSGPISGGSYDIDEPGLRNVPVVAPSLSIPEPNPVLAPETSLGAVGIGVPQAADRDPLRPGIDTPGLLTPRGWWTFLGHKSSTSGALSHSPGSTALSPPRGDPRTIAKWWGGLSQTERDEWIRTQPAFIGKLVGIDTASRDRANRIALDKDIEEIERERARVISELESEGAIGPTQFSGNPEKRRELQAQLALLNKRYAGATKLREELAVAGGNNKAGLNPDLVFLLDFDTEFAEGDGRGVVALGNPDTSKRVSIIVPGKGSTLENFDSPMNMASNLRRQIFERNREALPETAIITWLGYDAPETLRDADDPWQALPGAGALKDFVSGLRQTYSTPGELGAAGIHEKQNIFVIGHSYGSSLVGFAGTFDIEVEDLAMLASPGGGGWFAWQLGAPTRRIWAGRTEGDPIRFTFGITRLGRDPTNWTFGARKIPMGSNQTGHDSQEYFELGSVGLRNLAKIAIGRGNEVAGE